ncbi:MAG: hypothetical protein Q8J97_01370, partial [Flavobacteriaceae bacterium]|nr:hypothetical protein [Flavobacteriaceae bacterium]
MNIFSSSLSASAYVPSFRFKPTDRVEFGFVLLPDPSKLNDLTNLAEETLSNLSEVPSLKEKEEDIIRDGYNLVLTRLPHVSIGQYAALGIELDALKSIVDEVSDAIPVITEPMKADLSVTNENIFFDVENINASTNPVIVGLYKKFRDLYMTRIRSKQPIRQAYLQMVNNKNNPEELAFIQKHYQNWGTPEGDRIRPHFTLVYNYSGNKDDTQARLSMSKIPESLNVVRFTHIGLVAIDFWGNPLPEGLIYVVPLAGFKE